MASLVDESANAIAEALSPTPVAPSARWRWGTVRAVTEYGTMNVEVGGSVLLGIRASRHCMSAKVGDRVRVSYYGTEALVDAIRATESVETLYESSTWTIKRDGRTVMVQVHGATLTPSASTTALDFSLADYAPSYNVSSTVATNSGTSTQIARLSVYTDGGIYLPPAGYTSSGTWYGSLTYIY